MLVGLSGYLAGYNGSFEFKSGEVYPEELNYVFMRVFNAVFGILCVPLVFYTARAFKFSNQAVYLVTLMVLCGINVIDLWRLTSRKLVRDDQQIHLVGFDVVVLHRYNHVLSFQIPSTSQRGIRTHVVDLALCNGCLNWMCVQVHPSKIRITNGSVKWVGAFSMAVVGLYTIDDLWTKFGDLSMPKVRLFMNTVDSRSNTHDTGQRALWLSYSSPCSSTCSPSGSTF